MMRTSLSLILIFCCFIPSLFAGPMAMLNLQQGKVEIQRQGKIISITQRNSNTPLQDQDQLQCFENTKAQVRILTTGATHPLSSLQKATVQNNQLSIAGPTVGSTSSDSGSTRIRARSISTQMGAKGLPVPGAKPTPEEEEAPATPTAPAPAPGFTPRNR